MALKDHKWDKDSQDLGFRLKVAAVLLGIYAAMHLTVGGIVRVLTPLDLSDAVASDDSTMSSDATGASACPVDSTETSAGDSFARVSRAAAISTD